MAESYESSGVNAGKRESEKKLDSPERDKPLPKKREKQGKKPCSEDLARCYPGLENGGTDVAYGQGDIGEESFDMTTTGKGRGTGLKSYGNLGSSQRWDHL